MSKGKERSSFRVAVELIKVLMMAYRARIKQREARVCLRREYFRAIVGENRAGIENLQNSREGGNRGRRYLVLMARVESALKSLRVERETIKKFVILLAPLKRRRFEVQYVKENILVLI